MCCFSFGDGKKVAKCNETKEVWNGKEGHVGFMRRKKLIDDQSN